MGWAFARAGDEERAKPQLGESEKKADDQDEEEEDEDEEIDSEQKRFLVSLDRRQREVEEKFA